MNKKQLYQQLFLKTIAALGIKRPELEYRFHPKRKWRFDFCFVDEKLAVEIEGGVWIQGRHTRGSGFVGDMKKYNEAAIMGFSLLRVTWEEIENGNAALLIERFMNESKIS